MRRAEMEGVVLAKGNGVSSGDDKNGLKLTVVM